MATVKVETRGTIPQGIAEVVRTAVQAVFDRFGIADSCLVRIVSGHVLTLDNERRAGVYNGGEIIVGVAGFEDLRGRNHRELPVEWWAMIVASHEAVHRMQHLQGRLDVEDGVVYTPQEEVGKLDAEAHTIAVSVTNELLGQDVFRIVGP